MLIRTTITVPPELSDAINDRFSEFETEFGSLNHLQYLFLQHVREKYPDDVQRIGSILNYLRQVIVTNASTLVNLGFSSTHTDYKLEVPEDFSYQGIDLLINEFLQDSKWSAPGMLTMEVLS